MVGNPETITWPYSRQTVEVPAARVEALQAKLPNRQLDAKRPFVIIADQNFWPLARTGSE